MHISSDGNTIFMTCSGEGIFVLDSSNLPEVKIV